MIQGQTLAAYAMAGAAAVAGFTGTTAQADGHNNGAVSTSLGVDVASAYFFRGIGQENQGIIIQPWAEIGFALFENDDMTVAGYVGTWNSYHVSPGSSIGTGSGWYESDVYAGIGIGFGEFSVDVAYVVLYAPDAGGIFAEEIDITFGWDDSGFWADQGQEGFALAPYALLVIETDGGSDAGTEEGVYLELGIEPAFEVLSSEDYPVTLSFPIVLGISLDNYYEDGLGDDDNFGFLQLAAVLSTPLTFIPAEYGAWEGHAGVYLLLIEDSAQTIGGLFGTGGDDTEVYFSAGASMEY